MSDLLSPTVLGLVLVPGVLWLVVALVIGRAS